MFKLEISIIRIDIYIYYNTLLMLFTILLKFFDTFYSFEMIHDAEIHLLLLNLFRLKWC